MKYADGNWYSINYNGNIIPVEEIDKYLTLASNKIRMSILNRDITGFEEDVKNCTCSVAEILYNQNENREGIVKGITSEKVGDYSRTFSSNSTASGIILDTMELYLGHTGLLYRGLNV